MQFLDGKLHIRKREINFAEREGTSASGKFKEFIDLKHIF
jgi:hypothetical protein